MKKVVITGGTHSGKTSLILRLSELGYPVIPEAAIEVIKRLNELIGTEAQVAWRAQHLCAFQGIVWDRMLKLELGVERSADSVFYDRGFFDGFAYLKDHDEKMRELFDARYRSYALYNKAFVLETLPEYNERRRTGRTSTYQDSCETGKALARIYSEEKIETIWLPVMSVEERCEFVLSNI